MLDTKVGIIATYNTDTGEGTVHINGDIYYFDCTVLNKFKNVRKMTYRDHMRICSVVGEEVDVLIKNGRIIEIFV